MARRRPKCGIPLEMLSPATQRAREAKSPPATHGCLKYAHYQIGNLYLCEAHMNMFVKTLEKEQLMNNNQKPYDPNAPQEQPPPGTLLKMQRPMLGTGSPEKILVYNEDRSIEGEVQLPIEMIMTLFEGSFKIFVIGTLREDGMFAINELINPVNWPEW